MMMGPILNIIFSDYINDTEYKIYLLHTDTLEFYKLSKTRILFKFLLLSGIFY